MYFFLNSREKSHVEDSDGLKKPGIWLVSQSEHFRTNSISVNYLELIEFVLFQNSLFLILLQEGFE